MRIAWIEDDIPIIKSVMYPLEHEGATIDKFTSISDAKSSVDEILKADLIVLDIILPPGPEAAESNYPGRDLLHQWRSEYQKMPPVLVLTVVTNPQILAELQELKVADIINKPVLPSVLKARIHEVLAAKSQPVMADTA